MMQMKTMYRQTTAILLVLILCYCDNVESYFVPVVNSRISKQAVVCRSTRSDATITTTENEKLKFAVNITATSDPIENVTVNQLGQFLLTTICRDVFLSAGGKTQCIEESISMEFEQLWTAECQSHYGPEMLLESGDALVKSESAVQFPALKMVNVVYSGVKARSKGNLPYYDIILIGERKRVFGAPPIVWLFNKLTGHSAEKEDLLRPPSARVQSTISVEDKELGPCFCFDCSAEIVVEFPKALMKFAPVSKEKMEEQGTVAVRKAIEKDIFQALNSVNKVYVDWAATAEKGGILI